MSSLKTTLRLNSYRENLGAAIRHAQEERGSLLAALRFGVSAPDDVDAYRWSGMVGALRFAYEAGLRDDRDDVALDIRTAFADTFSNEQLDRFLELLEEDDLADERIEGTRMRDALLPNMVNTNFSTDLRILPVPGALPVVAPVVTARLEFDEHIAGQDSLVFQIPVEALSDLIEELQHTLDAIRSLSSTQEVTLPNWSRGGTSPGQGVEQ